MSDPFGGPAPPPGGPPRSTPLGAPPPGSPSGSQPGFGTTSPGFGTPPPGFGAQPPGYGQPPVAQPQWAQPPRAQGTNGLAIASFVLGLLWLCTVGSLLGIIFGFVGLAQIKSSDQKGRGLAIAGIVLGIVGILATIAVTVFVVDKAEEVLEEVPGEADDVTLRECRIGSDGQAEALLEITNDSSRTSAYLINVTFRSSGDTVEAAVSGVDLVRTDETVTHVVDSDEPMSAAGLRCEVTYVNRFASGGSEDS